MTEHMPNTLEFPWLYWTED